MRRSVRLALIAALLFLACVIAAASAVTITESPAVLNPGGQITITISGLNDGSEFNLLIDGKLAVTPGSMALFQTQNFNMPFSLKSGTVSASTHGTTATAFSVKPSGGKTYSVMDTADANGDFILPPQPYTISSGMYDFLQLQGPVSSGTTLLTTEMNLEGKKYGPSNSQITFTVQGITNGAVWVTALVDNNQVLAPTEVVIGSGIPSATPATTAAPVVTTTVPATGTTVPETTETLPEESVAVPTTTATATATAALTPGATTAAPAATTFYSADQQVSLTAQDVDYAALMMVSETNVPDTWLAIGSAYTIVPNSLSFDPPATLSFAAPSSGNDYAYFIGQYSNGAWTSVPSTPGAGTIDADIDSAGIYALMAYKPESTIQPAASGTAQQATPTPLVQDTSAPRIASIAQAASPSAAPTGAPLDSTVVAGALAIGLVLFARMRR
ncbi:hypothetical protein [Methanoregula sp.]|uniref:hypothetical protein n=1 Tax=Methanoregula sp. TaxID=2052170 RepID=UPI003BB1F798